MLKKYLVVLIFLFYIIPVCAAEPAKEKSIFDKQLEINKSNFEKSENLLKEGIISKTEYAELKAKYLESEKNLKLSQKATPYNNSKSRSISDRSNELKSNYNSMLDLYNKGLISEKELIDSEIQYRVSTFVLEEAIKNTNSKLVIPKLENPVLFVVRSSYKEVTSLYGLRLHPITGTYTMHYGIDIAAPIGSPVIAYSNGIVANASFGLYSGNFIHLAHGGGYGSLYLHLNKIIVKNKQYVKKGDIIGFVGTTGRSTGPHLHFELRKNNVALNLNSIVSANNLFNTKQNCKLSLKNFSKNSK